MGVSFNPSMSGASASLDAARDALVQSQRDASLRNAAAKTGGAPGDPKAKDRGQIKKLAEDFESLFLNLVLKSMRETIMKGGLVDGGNAESIYTSMLDDEYSKMMAG